MANASFSYLPTKVTLVSSIAATCLLMIGIVTFGLNPNQPSVGDNDSIQHPASLSSLASGCGDIFEFSPNVDQYGEIPQDFLDSEVSTDVPVHQMVVPVYGYMSPEPLGESQIRFYETNELTEPLPRAQILRTMYEQDTIVIWYAEDIATDDYTLLKEYVQAHDNILALKWQSAAKVEFPLDRKVAFSSWGVSQTCEFWTDDTFEGFKDFVDTHPVNRAETIPVVELTPNGTLPPLPRSFDNGWK